MSPSALLHRGERGLGLRLKDSGRAEIVSAALARPCLLDQSSSQLKSARPQKPVTWSSGANLLKSRQTTTSPELEPTMAPLVPAHLVEVDDFSTDRAGLASDEEWDSEIEVSSRAYERTSRAVPVASAAQAPRWAFQSHTDDL